MIRSTELLLIVRAQNQASGALHRVGRDMGLLGTIATRRNAQSAITARGEQLTMQRQNLISRNTLRQAAAETQMLTIRKQQSIVAKKLAAAQKTQAQAPATMGGLSSGISRNQKKLLQNAQLDASARTELSKKVGDATAKYNTVVRDANKASAAETSLLSQQQILRQRAVQTRYRSILAERQFTQALNANTAAADANATALAKLRSLRLTQYTSAIGTGLMHVGRLMQMFGMVGTAAFAAVAVYAAKFSSQVTLAATQTRLAGQGIGVVAKNSTYLQAQILGQMKQYTASSADMAKATYDIFSSMDIPLKRGPKILEIFNQAAIGGQTNLNDVTQAGITIMNNFRIKSVDGLRKAMDVLFATVRYGRMTFGELTGMMPQISPAFAAAGYGLKEMGQAAAFMTRVMPNTRRASTSLARLVEIFARKDFVAGAKKAGVTITDLNNRLLPIPTIVDRLAKKFPELTKAMKSGKGDVALSNFFKTITALGSPTGKGGTMGTIFARRAFTFFVTQAKLAGETYKEVAKDQGEFWKSFKAMKATPGVKWSIFINQLKAIAIEIGQDVIPALTNMAKPIGQLVRWFDNLDPKTRKQISTWAAMASVLTLVGGIISWVAGAWLKFLAVFIRFIGIGGAGVLTLLAIAAVVTALSGHWDGLNGIINQFFSFFTNHGVWGWIAYFGLASLMVMKLVRTLLILRASLVATAVMPKAGILGLVGALGGVGAAAGIGAIALGGAAIAALAMKQDMDSAKRAAQALATELTANQKFFTYGAKQSGMIGRLPGDIKNITDAKVSRDQAKATWLEAKKAKALHHTAANANLAKQAWQNYNLAIDAVAVANKNANDSFNAVARSIDITKQQVAQLSAKKAALKTLLDLAKGQTGFTKIKTLGIAGVLAEEISVGETILAQRGKKLQLGIRNMLVGMGKIGEIPKLKGGQLQLLTNVVANAQRFLSRHEIRIILGLDKGKLTPKIQAALAQAKRDVAKQKVQAKIQVLWTGMKGMLTSGGVSATKDAKAAQAKAAQWYASHPAKLKTIVIPPDTSILMGVGIQMVGGIAKGMRDKNAIAAAKAAATYVANQIEGVYKAIIQSSSPSKRFAKTVGAPITLGIAAGMLAPSNKPVIEASAAATINLFQGALITNLESTNKKLSKRTKLQIKKWLATADAEMARYNKTKKKGGGKEVDLLNAQANRAKAAAKVQKVTIKDLIKDTQNQANMLVKFNKLMGTLTSRGLPMDFLAQLEAMGTDGVKYMQMLAKATPKQLKTIIAAWNKAQKEIKKAQVYTIADLQAYKDTVMGNLKSMYDDFHSQMTDFYGGMFDGLDTILDDRIQAIQDKIDAFKSAFGDLFTGSWLSSDLIEAKKQWGATLNFTDIFNDLQAQTTAYLKYAGDLIKLQAAVPKDLYDEIVSLGPDAEPMIVALLSATPDQIAQYIAMWRSTHDAAVAAAVITPQDILDQMTKQAGDFTTWQASLTDLATTLPADLIQQLTAMGPSAETYLQALEAMTPAQRAQFIELWTKAGKMIDTATQGMLETQLKVWQQHGVDVIQALIDGMTAAEPTLTAYLEGLFKNIVSGAYNPSGGVNAPGGSVGTPPGDSGGGRGPGNAPVTYATFNVTAHQDESLESTLGRATFRLANRT